MIRVAVCDDDVEITEQITIWLKEISDELLIDIGIDICHDGGEIVAAVQNGKRYHMIFMDIQMKNMSGLEAAKEIRCSDGQTLLVYISSYSGYAVQSFETTPSDYLLKPLTHERFRATFFKLYHELLAKERYFVFETNRVSIKLPIKSILYFQSHNKQVEAVLENRSQMFNAKLDAIERYLEHSEYPFLRTHQSYLVSYYHIYRIQPECVTLDNGKTIQISRMMRDKVSLKYAELVMRTKGH